MPFRSYRGLIFNYALLQSSSGVAAFFLLLFAHDNVRFDLPGEGQLSAFRSYVTHGSHKPVTELRNGLDVAMSIQVFAQSSAQCRNVLSKVVLLNEAIRPNHFH